MKVIPWSYSIYALIKTGDEELFPVLGIGEVWGGTGNTIQIGWCLMAYNFNGLVGVQDVWKYGNIRALDLS